MCIFINLSSSFRVITMLDCLHGGSDARLPMHTLALAVARQLTRFMFHHKTTWKTYCVCALYQQIFFDRTKRTTTITAQFSGFTVLSTQYEGEDRVMKPPKTTCTAYTYYMYRIYYTHNNVKRSSHNWLHTCNTSNMECKHVQVMYMEIHVHSTLA